VQGLFSGSVNERTGVGSKLVLKAGFDVFANKEASGSVEHPGSIPENVDVSEGRQCRVMLLNPKMDRQLGSGAEDRLAAR